MLFTLKHIVWVCRGSRHFYTRIGRNRGNPQNTIMYCTQNVHTHMGLQGLYIPSASCMRLRRRWWRAWMTNTASFWTLQGFGQRFGGRLRQSWTTFPARPLVRPPFALHLLWQCFPATATSVYANRCPLADSIEPVQSSQLVSCIYMYVSRAGNEAYNELFYTGVRGVSPHQKSPVGKTSCKLYYTPECQPHS